MKLSLCGAALLVLAAPLHAQGVVQQPPVDAAAIQAQLTATQTTAQNALSTAASAQSTAASACQPMAAVPPPEVVGGAAGSGTNCRLVTSVQPRITRVGAFTTGSDGTVTVTWTDMGVAPALIPVPNVSATALMPPLCFPVTGSVTSTGGRIKCFVAQTVTVSILGAVVSPVTTAGAGVTGSYLAIPNS